MRPRAAVFVFHDIVEGPRLREIPATHRPYAISPDDFRAFALAARTSSRVAVPVGTLPQERASLFYSFTFDDGRASDYTEAFPVLRELGLRATFFVVPTLVESPGYAGWGQLREMVAAGMEVGSHSLTHPFVDRLDRKGVEREFGDSKRIIEDRLGAPVRAASLPYGWARPGVAAVLRELGYRVFCTSRVGWWYAGDPPFDVPRIRPRPRMAVEHFAAIVNGEPRVLWRLQALETVKNAAKACLGRRGWARLRAPLLRLRYSQGYR